MDDEIKEMKWDQNLLKFIQFVLRKSMAKAVAAQKQEKEKAEQLQKENELLKEEKDTMTAKVKKLEKDVIAKEVELKTLRYDLLLYFVTSM